jgi:hypothetical protein
VYKKGKGSRFVPIILTPKMIVILNWIIANSKNKTNPYLFANSAQSHIRGHDAIRHIRQKMAQQLEKPHLLNATLLRKQYSTGLQVNKDYINFQTGNFTSHNFRYANLHKENSLTYVITSVTLRWSIGLGIGCSTAQ